MGIVSRTLCSILEDAAVAYGTKPAVVIYDRSMSYVELRERSRVLAAKLLSAGLTRGDRVAIWLPNSFAFVEIAFACALAGLVFVPFNMRLRISDVTDALRKSGPRALFFTPSFLEIDYLSIVEELLRSGEVSELQLIVNADLSENVSVDEKPGILAISRWLEDIPTNVEFPEICEDDDAAIIFTSGTTSSPKGAVLLHRNLVDTAREVAQRMELSALDRMASAMPFYHNGGLVPTLFSCLMKGCTLYTQPRFDPAYLLKTISEHHCTVVSGVGTMFIMMLDSPAIATADLRTIRAARITGPADMRRRIYEKFGHPTLYSLYGMTEVTSIVTMTYPDASIEEQLNTNGKLLPGSLIRIVRPDGIVAPVGTPGEIQIGGVSVMKGYFRDSQATASVMADDKWVRSGDLGFMDERGNLVLIGRLKDMYRSGGENVACAEVEEFLRGHNSILHAAILGVPDPRLDEVGFAFIELRPGHELSAQDLQSYCRTRLANFKVPRFVEFRPKLPLTVSGRVEKHKLKEEALALSRDEQGRSAATSGRAQA